MNRRWIAALSTVAILGQALPSGAGIKDLLHGGKKKKEQELIKSCVHQRAWMAYFQDDEGELSPVRDTLNTANDQDWIGLRFTDYDGPRIRLGVLKVINKSADSEEKGWAEKIQVPVSGIQELLTVALYNTKRFDVIEQKRFDEIEKQQTRKDVVEPSPSSIMNFGKVLGAQYLVYGTVNEWNPDRASRTMGSGGPVAAGKNEAEVSITFVLTDVANGQILFTTLEQARMGEWSFGFGAPGAGAGATAQKTPVSYAIRACANKAALKVAMFLRDRKWKGTVVDVKKADIFINAGIQQGMGPQTKLSVQAVKGIIRDAENRMILGEDLRAIGTLEVIAVQNAFSVARVVESSQPIKKGDRVEIAANQAQPPTIPACDALDTSGAR